ncbi:MAG: hypothetical protein ACNA8W_10225, partial [Bradymonadaceae bacterium]
RAISLKGTAMDKDVTASEFCLVQGGDLSARDRIHAASPVRRGLGFNRSSRALWASTGRRAGSCRAERAKISGAQGRTARALFVPRALFEAQQGSSALHIWRGLEPVVRQQNVPREVRLFRHPDVVYPGSGVIWHGAFRRQSGAMIAFYRGPELVYFNGDEYGTPD